MEKPKKRTAHENAFAEADKNNDGRLDFEEFKDLMVGVMEVTDEDEIRETFNKVDMDGNGFVDLKEFKSLNLLQTATSMHGSTMRQARLADLILEEDEELQGRFDKYGIVEDIHGDYADYTIILFSWYTGKSDEILDYYESFLSTLKNVRVVAVSGPFRNITIRPGNPGHCWYDYYSDLPSTEGDPNLEDKINEEHLKESRKDMLELLDKEVARMGDSTRVFLVGCSQGGFMALDVCMNSPYDLGGLFGNCTALGSYSPITTDCTETPIFQYHGDKDEVVGLELCKKGIDRMKEKGFSVTLKVEEEKTHYTDQQGECEHMAKTFKGWMSNGPSKEIDPIE